MIFLTENINKLWYSSPKLLEQFYNSINNFDFMHAQEESDKLETLVSDFKDNSNGYPDEYYNDCFIFKKLASLFKFYAEYWSQISNGKYADSWDKLQDVLDSLRTINRFTDFNQTSVFKFLEKQLQSLEIIYPYKLFASIEAVVGKTKCSICGKNIDSVDCHHIAGELYRGKVAYGIVEEIKDLISVSLVENPEDKRCKLGAISGKQLNFEAVKYLADMLLIKKCNPLKISHCEEKTIQTKITDIKVVGRNSICPCGSGKKFKKCCIGKEYVEKKHVDIVLSNKNLLTPKDFFILS